MAMIDGIILVDKPLGLSSNALLQRVKRLLDAKKAGHTGSLDPLATGMLPICLGEATKFSQYLLDADKAYDVTGYLGAVSSTGDAEGEITQCSEQVNVSTAALDAVLKQLTGPIQQVPPMYSALKHQGKPLYTYARRGEVIERPPRDVMIYDIKCREIAANYVHLTVKCSKGTYIRTLVESIGELLGVGAYVTELHRTYTAGFEQEPMWSLEALEAENLEARRAHLLLPERAVLQFKRFDVSLDVMHALYQGKVVSDLAPPAADRLSEEIVRLYTENNLFFGLGELTPAGDLKVKRLTSTAQADN
ncbi:MAG: tRNA pseudouridine(55) synthase TruB [Gammaproteobacteria bacterium]|nr:tRNA pseudouridine(55) synthase TruB [Gammaproteobacteria bacterium]MCH9717236.1 tRNA pseudouridine(55) synthase TruB [Gammaproteobacteria bacterium]MCH9763774.1 tRNA pseudouridine(55) synthase TruB [Gammaproteobacteria bacterium]